MPHKVLVLDDANGDGERTRRMIKRADHTADVRVVHDLAAAQAELCTPCDPPYTHLVVDLYFDQPGASNGIAFLEWLLRVQEQPDGMRALPPYHNHLPIFASSWSEEYVVTMQGIVDQHREMVRGQITLKTYAGDSQETRQALARFMH